MEELAFHPKCCRQIPAHAEICPHYQASFPDWEEKTYSQRLIDEFEHPFADVRMQTIIALGLRGEKKAEEPLVDGALRHPIDVVEGPEIINSLRLIRHIGCGLYSFTIPREPCEPQ